MTQSSLLLMATLAMAPAFGMALRIRYVLERADAELEAYLDAVQRTVWAPG
jgi:hypothetical protein